MNKKFISREILLSKLFLLATVTVILLFYTQEIYNAYILWHNLNYKELSALVVFLIIATFILYGNAIFHLTRVGYYKRLFVHIYPSKLRLDSFISETKLPLVTYLIPSYKEDPKVILQTIWSIVLQDYPKKQIVLLIDNPPHPKSADDLTLLSQTRDIPKQILQEISLLQQTVAEEYIKLKNTNSGNAFDKSQNLESVKLLYNLMIRFLREKIVEYKIVNHVDRFFCEQILKKWIDELQSDLIADITPLKLIDQLKRGAFEVF